MNNVMLDLETWGTRPGSGLRSVGAVLFDPYGTELGATFYANISDTCVLTKDEATMAWWERQSKRAQDALMNDQQPFRRVAADFALWFTRNRGMFVWSQGANFDEVLWSEALRRAGMTGAPWKFYDVRDTRTAYDIAGFDPRTIRRLGTYHNALDDAKHQARCVQAAYAKVIKRIER